MVTMITIIPFKYQHCHCEHFSLRDQLAWLLALFINNGH